MLCLLRQKAVVIADDANQNQSVYYKEIQIGAVVQEYMMEEVFCFSWILPFGYADEIYSLEVSPRVHYGRIFNPVK